MARRVKEWPGKAWFVMAGQARRGRVGLGLVWRVGAGQAWLVRVCLCWVRLGRRG